MKKAICNILLLAFSFFLTQSSIGQGLKTKVLPTSEQVKWAESAIGVIIDFDMNIFAPATYDIHQKETLPPLSIFNPSRLSTDYSRSWAGR